MGNEKNLSNDEKKLLLAVKKDDFRGTSDLLATLKKKSKRLIIYLIQITSPSP